jgi:hypothetical protein
MSDTPPPPRCDPSCGPEEHIAGCPNGDDLRDRIAKAIADAQFAFDNGDPYNGPEDSDVLADAVIAALNLDKQFGCPVAGHHHCRCSHRYTTEWEDNDE